MHKKQVIIVIVHIHKCAGSTIKKHIIDNFESNEYLLLYWNENPFLNEKNKISTYIKNLTSDQKKTLKVIMGHGVYYGIHKLFADCDVRYITFLRKPVERAISHYYFRKQMYDNLKTPKYVKAEYSKRWKRYLSYRDWNLAVAKQKQKLQIEFFSKKSPISFLDWLVRNEVQISNYISNFLYEPFHPQIGQFEIYDELGTKSNCNENKFRKVCGNLKNFYFIGFTEHALDFLILYHILDISVFSHKSNKTHIKSFKKISMESFELFNNLNTYDKKLYNFANNLNKKFRRDFSGLMYVCFKMKFKQMYFWFLYYIDKTIKLVRDGLHELNFYLCTLFYESLFLNFYKFSARLKKRAPIYSKLIKIIKRITKIP